MSRKLSLHLSFAVSHSRGRRGVSQEKGQGIKTAVGNWLNASSSVKQNWPSQRIKQGQKAWVSTTSTLQRTEISWILFQYRHYFPCIQKQQNSYMLAKHQKAAPIFCCILLLKAEGSSRIILQRKTEDQEMNYLIPFGWFSYISVTVSVHNNPVNSRCTEIADFTGVSQF